MMRLKIKIFYNPKRIIICSVLAVIILISLFFSNELEILFKFKPNLKKIEVEKDLEIHYLDVGQADCTLIRLPNNETVVIDSGTSYQEKVLERYLSKVFLKKSKTIDYLILTHSDVDHIGNIMFLLDNYKVKNIYLPHSSIINLLDESDLSDKVYLDIINKVNNLYINNNINVFTNFDNLEIKDYKTGEVYLDWLYPNTEVNLTTNDYSPIIEICYKNKLTLVCGDASSDAENICMLNNVMKDIDVLKFAHHGSNNSVSTSFLETINPEYAIISTGTNNSYDFPSKELLDRVYSFNPELYKNILRTDIEGNIIEHIDSSGNLNFYNIKNINDYSYSKWYILVITLLVIDFYYALNLKRKRKKKRNAPGYY